MTMIFRLRNRHFFVFDVLFCALVPILALSMRLGFSLREEYLPAVLIFTIIGVLIKLPTFYIWGLYRRFWRFASIEAMVSVSVAVFLALSLTTGIYFLFQGYLLPVRPLLPRSIPIMDGILTTITVGGSRLIIRIIDSGGFIFRRNQKTKLVLIAGAGDAGQLVAREINSSNYVAMHLFGFVDDNPEKIGTIIHGVRVWGTLEETPELVREYNVQELIIAMPNAPGQVIRKMVKACQEPDLSIKIIPGVFELLSIEPSIDRLRDVEIVDLLRREPARIDLNEIERLLMNKRVLVTGAGGSIGSEMCIQIANCKPAQLVILGHGENSLFALQSYLDKIRFYPPNLDFVLADIRDPDRLDTVFTRFRPEVVFHAAAHKNIPLMEDNVEEAVTNNIWGTWNLVQISKKFNVEKFVFASSSKAVQPTNVMGMTKRVAELIVQMAAAETNRPYISVRFGNVLGTRGSVIPIFQRQIKMGGPVTVTHPEMLRYFLTAREVVNLVLQAATMGQHGEIFMLDMGDPIRITELARDMIELAGYVVDQDIKIVYTGLRPGEQLLEYLFLEGEDHLQTRHEKIYTARNELHLATDQIHKEVEALKQLAEAGETSKLRRRLIQLTT